MFLKLRKALYARQVLRFIRKETGLDYWAYLDEGGRRAFYEFLEAGWHGPVKPRYAATVIEIALRPIVNLRLGMMDADRRLIDG